MPKFDEQKNVWIKDPEDSDYPLQMQLTKEKEQIFFGELEAAMGSLYQLFLKDENAPNTSFDRQLKKVISENIPGLMVWKDLFDTDEVEIDENGNVLKVNKQGDVTEKKISGLEAIGISAWFLGENDLTAENFGIVELEDHYRAVKYDHGQSGVWLYNPINYKDIYKIFSADESEGCIGFANVEFPEGIVNKKNSTEKMFKCVYRIINTNFDDIEKTLVKNISDEFAEERSRILAALRERQKSLKNQAEKHQEYINFLKLIPSQKSKISEKHRLFNRRNIVTTTSTSTESPEPKTKKHKTNQ